MRSKQVHRALLQIPNRYALCQTISRSARMLHKAGSPIDGTLNTALEILNQDSKQAIAPAPARPVRTDPDSLYRQMQYAH
ncbi:MAG TPA: hypothetical protein VL346_02185 [Acidobacteriaceae bacterium]|nr:hypothetical protein [Acidobacteriaceae bacterium]